MRVRPYAGPSRASPPWNRASSRLLLSGAASPAWLAGRAALPCGSARPDQAASRSPGAPDPGPRRPRSPCQSPEGPGGSAAPTGRASGGPTRSPRPPGASAVGGSDGTPGPPEDRGGARGSGSSSAARRCAGRDGPRSWPVASAPRVRSASTSRKGSLSADSYEEAGPAPAEAGAGPSKPRLRPGLGRRGSSPRGWPCDPARNRAGRLVARRARARSDVEPDGFSGAACGAGTRAGWADRGRGGCRRGGFLRRP